MRRREFIILLGGATAWVSPARAQEPRRVIGFLSSGSSDTFPGGVAAFVQGLEDTGFIEGNNISIEWRWAEVSTTVYPRWRPNWSAAAWP